MNVVMNSGGEMRGGLLLDEGKDENPKEAFTI